MKKIKDILAYKTALLALIFMGCINFAFAGDYDKLSSAQFMRMVRTPPQVMTWAQLQGEIINMKRKDDGQRIISKEPIYLAVRFSSEMIFAEIILGKDEIYSIGQSYSMLKNSATVLRDGNKSSNQLSATFGIRPEDLTMSFLFWDMVEELPSESVGMVACRVFNLISPDRKEKARVYISRNNYFPVKVEWSKVTDKKGDTDIVRTLEVVSFEKVNELYLVKELKFYGPGWRTNVQFSDNKAGLVSKGTPKELFRNLVK